MSGLGTSPLGRSAAELMAFAEAIEEERQAEIVRRRERFSFIPRPKYNICEYDFARQFGPRSQPSPLSIGIEEDDAAFWLTLCEILCRPADDFDSDYRRGWTIACRLTGLGWSHIRQSLVDKRYSSAFEAAKLWRHHMSPYDHRYVGFVYIAKATKYPDLVKIGFSRNPEKRMKSLSRQNGFEMTLVSSRAGTMLHEWALHMTLYPGRKMPAPEMYPIEQVCSWLLPKEMRVAA